MSNAQIFTKANWQAEVINSPTPVLVDFFAEWCGPCRMMGPVLDKVAISMAGKVKVGKVDSDNDQEIAGQFNISSIPCLILMINGKEKDRLVGYNQEAALTKWLEANI